MKSIEYKIFSILGSAFAWTSVILVIVILLWVSTSTSTLFKFGNILQKYTGTGLQLARAIGDRPGYIIYYKLDKYKEIKRYTSIYILQ